MHGRIHNKNQCKYTGTTMIQAIYFHSQAINNKYLWFIVSVYRHLTLESILKAIFFSMNV